METCFDTFLEHKINGDGGVVFKIQKWAMEKCESDTPGGLHLSAHF